MTTQAGEAQQVWCDQADKADTAGARMFGFAPDEIIGMHVSKVVAAEDLPRVGARLATLADKAVATGEWHLQRKDRSRYLGEGFRLEPPTAQG